MQITIDVEKTDSLFLKQEMGTASIGEDELSFGICLPTGAPYVHVRGEYYTAPDIFKKMLRATHEQGSHEEHPAPCDEQVAEIAAAHNAPDEESDCPGGVDICAGRRCTHEPDAAGPDEG